MKTTRTISTKANKDSNKEYNTKVTVTWPEGTPDWVAELGTRSVVIAWQSQLRSKLGKGKIKEVPSTADISAADFKPQQRQSTKDKALSNLDELLQSGKLTMEELKARMGIKEDTDA